MDRDSDNGAPLNLTGGSAPEEGIALCLSGGGYRAMLFHLGALLRLNQWGYLPKLKRISSVSGGSITAGALACRWSELSFDSSGVAQNFELVSESVRELARKTVDVPAVILGIALPWSAISDRVVKSLKQLYGDATLADLPDEPRFVINATNVQSGALWRFSKPYMRDWLVGEVKNPRVPLAVAVAASAAFPPILSPLRLRLEPSDFTPNSGVGLQFEPYTRDAVLTDGGVYDNLGLETAWKRYATILVSDGGGKMAPLPSPAGDWGRHSKRVLDVIDNQVRSLRKRQVIGAFRAGIRRGTYWGIRTNIADYGLGNVLPADSSRTLELADIPTRLQAVPEELQRRLINWGFAVCDAAMRRHVDAALPAASHHLFPIGV